MTPEDWAPFRASGTLWEEKGLRSREPCRLQRLQGGVRSCVHVHDLLSLLKPTRAQESTLSYSDTRCMKLSELSC